jgi:L-rhamnonate dehydratase
MKITNVEVLVLKSPGLYRSTDTAEEPPGPTYMGLMKVSTDAGITGYSDMETAASVAKAAVEAPRWSEGDIQAFDGLASLIIGENPLEVERLWYRMYRGSIYYGRRGVAMQAISAIDIALWDIMGKAYGQPVHVLLGGKWRDKVRAYASTLFRPTPAAMREAATRYIDQGFTAVKFGWGVFGRDPKLDVQLVAAARETLGPERDLLVDTGWFIERTPKQAIQTIRAIEPFKPFFVEEILHPEDYDGYRRVSEAVDTLVACGEQESTEWGFRELIERARVDVLQPDLTRCGGFTAARKIVHMAEMANVLVIPHSWSSDLLTAASLHLNAFQRRAEFVEFNTSQGPLSRAMVREPLRIVDGFVEVPTAPGLGVDVNEDTLEQYRIA